MKIEEQPYNCKAIVLSSFQDTFSAGRQPRELAGAGAAAIEKLRAIRPAEPMRHANCHAAE